MERINVFLRVKDKIEETTPMGHLLTDEILKYKKTIEDTDFTDGGYCMRLVEPTITKKDDNNLELNLRLYPDIHSNKCQYACYPSDCPLTIVHGKCKHPLIIELIGKKFRPGMYTQEYQNYLKGIER